MHVHVDGLKNIISGISIENKEQLVDKLGF